MKKILILLILLSSVYASTAAAFLDGGISARSDSLGQAFAAVADDLDAFYYNPAGFGFQRRLRFSAMGTKVNNQYNVYYAGYGMPLFKGYGAINCLTAGVDNIPETKYENGEIVDTGDNFNYSANAFIASYGIRLADISTDPEIQKMSYGLSVKYLKENLYKNHASGLGLDMGVLYRVDDAITVGFSILNLLEPVMTWDTDSKEKDTVERVQKAGVAWRISPKLQLTGDMTFRKNDSLSGVGAEYLLNDIFALRGGVMTNKYALGFGLYYGIQMDYVYLIAADQLMENTHKVSLSYVFGPAFAAPKKEESPKPAVEKQNPIPQQSAVTPSVAAVPTRTAQELTIVRSQVAVTGKKAKWFCRVNNSGDPLPAKMTVIIRSAENKVLDQRSEEITIASGESVLEQHLYVGVAKGSYEARGYIKYGDVLKETTDQLTL